MKRLPYGDLDCGLWCAWRKAEGGGSSLSMKASLLLVTGASVLPVSAESDFPY